MVLSNKVRDWFREEFGYELTEAFALQHHCEGYTPPTEEMAKIDREIEDSLKTLTMKLGPVGRYSK